MKTQYSALNIAVRMGLTLTAGLFYSTSAFSADGEDAVAEKNIEKIAVVGSRSAPRSISDSPVPIDIT